ncbi:MAG: 3'-5' exoribonuclease [Bacillus sp. (in: Bacteria)]|nr:3'-5' exoribonuclease [Bacillus sp. (in: firmicutes)]
MNPMIQFLKQLSGKMNPNMYSAVSTSRNAEQIAYIRQLQREFKKKDSLQVPFSQLNIVVFDLETTGFFPNKGDRILSIGAVKVKGDQVLAKERFYSLVQSRGGLTPEIVSLTGITERILQDAPPMEQVLLDFYEFVNGDTLVAHHASHERRFMQQMSWSILKTSFDHRIVDTLFLTKITAPNLPLVTLDQCCEHFNITIQKRHHALFDALATAQLWADNIRFIQRLGYENLKDVYAHLASIS